MGQNSTRLGRGLTIRGGSRRFSGADGTLSGSKLERFQEFHAAFTKRFGKEEAPIDAFLEFYRAALPDNQSNPLSKHLIRQLHNSKDRVRLSDLTSLLDVLEDGAEEERLELLFSLFDLDGNGRIDENEFLQIVRDSYTYSRRFSMHCSGKTPIPADERIRFTFNSTDINSDGVLSKSEFIDACSVNKDVCEVALTCLRRLLRELASKL